MAATNPLTHSSPSDARKQANVEKKILLHWFNRWHGSIHEAMEQDKAAAETLNAINTVGAFIAGIQSGIIALTLNLPPFTPLSRAANTLSFVGLILDVLGTFLGVLHVLLLQRRIRDHTTITTSLNSRKDDIVRSLDSASDRGMTTTTMDPSATQSELEFKAHLVPEAGLTEADADVKRDHHKDRSPLYTALAPVTFAGPDSILAQLVEDIRTCGHSVAGPRVQDILSQADQFCRAYSAAGGGPKENRTTISELLVTELQLNSPKDNTELHTSNSSSPLETTASVVQSEGSDTHRSPKPAHSHQNRVVSWGLNTFMPQVASILVVGAAPLLTLGLGIGCLIASTILLAAAAVNLSKEVWITCVAVLVAVFTLSNASLFRIAFLSG